MFIALTLYGTVRRRLAAHEAGTLQCALLRLDCNSPPFGQQPFQHVSRSSDQTEYRGSRLFHQDPVHYFPPWRKSLSLHFLQELGREFFLACCIQFRVGNLQEFGPFLGPTKQRPQKIWEIFGAFCVRDAITQKKTDFLVPSPFCGSAALGQEQTSTRQKGDDQCKRRSDIDTTNSDSGRPS